MTLTNNEKLCLKHKKLKCSDCKIDLITDKMLNGYSLTLKDILEIEN